MKDEVLRQLDEGLARMALVPAKERLNEMIRDGLIDRQGQPLYGRKDRRSEMSKEDTNYVVAFPMVAQVVVQAGSKSAAIEAGKNKLEEILAGSSLSAVIRLSGSPGLFSTTPIDVGGGEVAKAAPKFTPKVKLAPVEPDEDEDDESEADEEVVDDDGEPVTDEDDESEADEEEDEPAPPKKRFVVPVKSPAKVSAPVKGPTPGPKMPPKIPLVKKK